MKTEIIVHDTHVHHETGHVTYTLKTKTTHESATWEGPPKQYGVDAQTLRDRFNNDLSQWEAHIALEHKSLIGAHPVIVDAAAQRKGKVIG